MRRWKQPRPKKRPRRTRESSWTSRPLAAITLRRAPLGRSLANEMRSAILLGQLRPGRRLESCRTLARELSVSVGVVREALAQLRGEGLVEVRHGVGTFVLRRVRASRALKAARRGASRKELRTVLRVVDPLLAGEAARRARHSQKADLRVLMWERRRARQSLDARIFADVDAELHELVARAAGMPLTASARRMASVGLRPEMAARSSTLGIDHRLDALHEALVVAIEDGRAARARRAAGLISAIETRPPRPP